MTALNTSYQCSCSNDPLTVTVPDAARRLGVSERTISRLIDDGKIPRRKLEGRVVIPYAALKAYAENLPVE